MVDPRADIAAAAVPGIPDIRLRHARMPDDWAPLAELVAACRAADGVEEGPTAEYLAADWGHVAGLDPSRDFLLAELDGRLVGFVAAWPVMRDDILALESWGAVHPDVRRRGLGTALNRWARSHLAARAVGDPRAGTREYRGWALDVETGDCALFAGEGYQPIRFGFEMRRPLGGVLPEPPLPAGLELRPVEHATIRTILAAEDEAFRDHWGYRAHTEEDVEALLAHPETDPSLWQVAWDGDEVAGVVLTTIYRSENERLGLTRGWLDRVSVRRPWRGRGLAKALCAASLRVLRERGMDESWLGVDAANPTGALRLYEGLGFLVVRRWFAFGRPLDGPAPDGWRSGEAVERAAAVDSQP